MIIMIKKIFFIIPVAIVIILLVILVAEVAQMQGIPSSVSEIKSVLPSSYDCAKEFDKFANLHSKEEYWTGYVVYSIDYVGHITDKNEFDFLDNRCYTTYNSWMTESGFQYFIEERKGFFDMWSFQEQSFNHEIDCNANNIQNNDKRWCDVKEKSTIYFNALEKHCSRIDKNSSQEEQNRCITGLFTELEKAENKGK